MATVSEHIHCPAGSALEPAAQRLCEGFSLEATPAEINAGAGFLERLAPGTQVYLPFLPGNRRRDTVAACRTLQAHGLHPVPHLAARAMADAARLADWLAPLGEAGVDSLLLIAGDADRPAGFYRDTLDVLESGLLCKYGFRRLGFAAHPEGHRVASAAELQRALAEKRRYAEATGTAIWLVSQFTFNPLPVVAWLQRLRACDRHLPVRIGVAGPTRLSRLLRYALRCGVVPSAQVFGRGPRAALKLLGSWSPADMLNTLGQQLPESAWTSPTAIHVFPFGGAGETIDLLGAPAALEMAGDGV